MLKRLIRPGTYLQARSGAVAVEFALIAPILILIFFATIELAQALDCRTRVIDATSSVADLIAQGDSVTETSLAAMEDAVKAIIYPYDTDSRVGVVISSIKQCTAYDVTEDASDSSASCYGKSAGDLVVAWSWAAGTSTTKRTAVPSDLSTDVFSSIDSSSASASGAGVVMVETTYIYSSPTTQLLTGDVTLHWTAYSIPRGATAVTYSN